MDERTVSHYAYTADLGELPRRKVAPSVQTQSEYAPETVRRLGHTLLIGRYRKTWQDELVYVRNPAGRLVWMSPTMHRVYLAVVAELEANRDLSSTAIARLAGASQGYVSKVIRFLERFGFVHVLGVWRGRWGRIVAKLASIIPPVPRRVSTYGGMIKAERFADYPGVPGWGAWDRAIVRIESANGGG